MDRKIIRSSAPPPPAYNDTVENIKDVGWRRKDSGSITTDDISVDIHHPERNQSGTYPLHYEFREQRPRDGWYARFNAMSLRTKIVISVMSIVVVFLITFLFFVFKERDDARKVRQDN